jgi:hypothetical protein
MRRAARIDSNQPMIVDGLRAVGATVQPIHTIGRGCPDLLVGYRGRNYLMEVKDGSLSPSRRYLTEDEEDWHRGWNGQVTVVEDLTEALRVIGVPV